MAIKWSTDVLPCRPCSAKPVYSILTCRGTLPTYYFYELRRTSADSSSSKVVLSTHGKAADLRIALLCSVRNLREFFIRIILLLVLRFWTCIWWELSLSSMRFSVTDSPRHLVAPTGETWVTQSATHPTTTVPQSQSLEASLVKNTVNWNFLETSSKPRLLTLMLCPVALRMVHTPVQRHWLLHPWLVEAPSHPSMWSDTRIIQV